ALKPLSRTGEGHLTARPARRPCDRPRHLRAGRRHRGRPAHGAGGVTPMRAVVLPRPGSADVLEIRELETPTPRDGEVLVRIRAATVTRGDVALRRIPRLMWPLLRIGMGLRRKRI